uniref:Uncharacterized protein n=1 Tax=Romanomermis culicivorax TaxID=13658 RepID=A0A915KJN6_ROMCU
MSKSGNHGGKQYQRSYNEVALARVVIYIFQTYAPKITSFSDDMTKKIFAISIFCQAVHHMDPNFVTSLIWNLP